jgi:hypothetical protein
VTSLLIASAVSLIVGGVVAGVARSQSLVWQGALSRNKYGL